MDDLRRELAPIATDAWTEIESQARTTLKTYLAARKLVDLRGPLGWDYSAVNLGRVRQGQAAADGVQARVRQVQPLIELRVPFELSRSELDDVSRGAADPDLDPLLDAARRLALAEDRLVFYGHADGGVRGLCPASSHRPVPMVDDEAEFPRAVLEAVEALREAGVAGPYAMALSAEAYKRLGRTTAGGGYPVIRHVQRFIDGPIVWAPGLDGAIVLSQRGGDFELAVGRDISLGYLDHDRNVVHLYIEESLTFRVLTPEAAIAFARVT
ncbi:MAG TPA: family 1 encapsulin nanocompartment shell protein [Planctomycetaceae bacterium]|nr:family 1 encapsulin nanocompartment shell protein [Planctomycetaceae bacterium]